MHHARGSFRPGMCRHMPRRRIFALNTKPNNNYRSSFGQKTIPCQKPKFLISISVFQLFSFSAFRHEH